MSNAEEDKIPVINNIISENKLRDQTTQFYYLSFHRRSNSNSSFGMNELTNVEENLTNKYTVKFGL